MYPLKGHVVDTTEGTPVGRRRQFGQITKLPSGRHRARYADPEGRRSPSGEPLRHNAPVTFDARIDAEAWLTDERRLIAAGTWTPPTDRAAAKRAAADGVLRFGDYAEAWLRDRDLKPRTRAHYRRLLDRLLLPTLAHVELAAITPAQVRQWHALTGTATPTLRAHAYGLLRTIMGQAEREELIARNPCQVRGAGTARRARRIRTASLAELEALTLAMPERYRSMVLVAAWCALRFGELAELRRGDVDLTAGVLRVRRGVVRVNGRAVVGAPKSDAGVRDVAIPPHLVPALTEHLAAHVGPGKVALLWPAADGTSHLAPSTLYRVFFPAREAAGRPDLRWHDLRHTGAVLAAQSGATLAELMGRLGHATPVAALRYQHVAEGRDAAIAARLSKLAGGDQ